MSILRRFSVLMQYNSNCGCGCGCNSCSSCNSNWSSLYVPSFSVRSYGGPTGATGATELTSNGKMS